MAKYSIYIPFVFFCVIFALQQNVYSVAGLIVGLLVLAIDASVYCQLKLEDKRNIQMRDKIELKQDFKRLEEQVQKFEKDLLANSQFMADELTSIKSAIQIKQMGR